MITILQQLEQAEVISRLDFRFACLIARKQQPYRYPQPIADLAVLLAALSSYYSQNGSTCLDPKHFENGNFFDLAMQPEQRQQLWRIQQKLADIRPNQWQQLLQRHIAFTHSGGPPAPLIWANGLLYLFRNRYDEQQIAQCLLQRLQQRPPQLDTPKLALFLQQLFPSEPQGQIDWQKMAVATALRHSFSLISGGPGTGKTRTVCSLLLTLQWQQQQLRQAPLKIALTAPTGKAAARLSESIGHTLAQFPSAVSLQLKGQIPLQATTLHRLLGTNARNEQVRYHQTNPLPLDLLVVDEASMVDLNLFAKLLNSLSPQTRLVLLGDKDQLTSVEVGAVMAELCKFLPQGYSPEHCAYLQQVTGQSLSARPTGEPIRDCLCFLRKSYRFSEDSGIKALADSVNSGDANGWSCFERFQDLSCYEYPQPPLATEGVFSNEPTMKNRTLAAVNLILQQASVWYGEYLRLVNELDEFEPQKIDAVFKAFNQVRLLTGLRQGEFGVERLNLAVSERLRRKGLLQFRFWQDWYHGKPIMVLQNDPAVALYNGDVGLLLTDKHGNSRVWFEIGEGQYRDISPSRVPSHETAFVMTVHKSQGSEFARTALVLPLTMNPILSRELIYTAVTRAKTHFSLFGSPRIWQSAVKRPIRRSGGLYRQLSRHEAD
ncbi:hypothetical protein OA57_04745 [Chelonobacter oris]|uniref:RecBCD enzyme subunit RecD n=1 Tax=Chelonobacter oris TaxID=505317 RepID=A0A0A3ASH9_9PAST|nr:exodeoxyribonuclease V subunit alpha [Chelonobacter oris]KGQ70677.1 hypothetical protein OA57_04745 [Chelonobacter oris]